MDRYATCRRNTTRRSTSRRRHTTSQPGGLRRLLAFQSLVSVVLLFIIIIVKIINIPATNTITGQVRYVLDHNVELKSIYANAQTILVDIKNSIIPSSEKTMGSERFTASDDYLKETDTGQKAPAIEYSQTTPALPQEPQMPPELYPKTSVLAASSGVVDAYISDQFKSYGMISPTDGMLVTPFGEITGPAGVAKLHKGIDISVDEMGAVKAVLDGIVADFGSAPGYGNYVKLRHDNELTTVYANCSSIAVVINDPVKKGDVIAGVGEDSRTGGGHLHFEVWQEGDPVDPLGYIIITAG